MCDLICDHFSSFTHFLLELILVILTDHGNVRKNNLQLKYLIKYILFISYYQYF